jgi:hypothetical protein
MIQDISETNTAAAATVEREMMCGNSTQSLWRRGGRYMLKFTAPLERESELTPREAFSWGEWCGAFLPFDEFTREDLVREMFPHQWRQFLAEVKERAPMNAQPCRVPRRRRDPWTLSETATACFDAMMEHTSDGEIAKAVACALEYSKRTGIRLSVALGINGLEGRICALEATARRYPGLRRKLAPEISRLRSALDLANGAAHRLCMRGLLSWPRPAGADILRDIEAELMRVELASLRRG